jgi:aminopeptidase N
VLPSRADRADYLLAEILDHLAFFERTLGPYPWRAEKYAVAHTPHLGMEHQTITAYGSTFTPEPDGFDWLHHHELAHEWWGNLVTAPDWNDFWIHEGFGSYMQALYLEDRYGADAYHVRVEGYRAGILNEKPVAPRASQTTDAMYFSSRGSNPDIYSKGAAVLHTLRYAMGDSLFRVALRRFAYPDAAAESATDGSQARFATTDDFLALVNTLTGDDYAPFFEVYLRHADLPVLVTERDGRTLRLRWQAPADSAFSLPLEVEVDGVVRRVEVGSQNVAVDLRRADAQVEIDPQGWVLFVHKSL